MPAPLAAAALAAPSAIVMFLSVTVKSTELIDVNVPLTVKSPLTVTSLNVTLSVVPTAWPISNTPVACVYVTPVPALTSARVRAVV